MDGKESIQQLQQQQQQQSNVAAIHRPSVQLATNSQLPAGGERFTRFMLNYSPSYILQNKGATARDHLANERTFLSYLRTSLSMLTVGVAVTQLFRLGPSAGSGSDWDAIAGKVLGCIFIVCGFLFIVFGMLRYFFAQALLVKGLFPASRGSITFGGIALMLIIITVFIATVIMQPPK